MRPCRFRSSWVMHRSHQGRFGEHALLARPTPRQPSPVITRSPTRQRAAASRPARAASSLAFVALGVRLFFIQVVDHAHYAELSVAQVRVRPHHDGAARRHLRPQRADPRRLAPDVAGHRRRLPDHASGDARRRRCRHSSRCRSAKLDRLLSEKHDGYVIMNNELNLNAGRKLSSIGLPGHRRPGLLGAHVSQRPHRDVGARRHERRRRRDRPGLEYEYQKLLAGQTGITREFVSSLA